MKAKRKIFFIVIYLFICGVLFGQKHQTLSGYIYDSESKEALIGANIYIPEYKKGSSTNQYGFFSITTSISEVDFIVFSFIGYKSDTLYVKNILEKIITVELYPGIIADEIVIIANKINNKIERNEIGVVSLPIKQIKKLPAIFGEVDIIKALQLTPGVQSGGEAKSTLHVRGGSPDQNLILLDNVPLYYVAHFGGFISIFNADAISDVKLIKGGFPARYGGKLSSVLNVSMKEGNKTKNETFGTLGLLSSKISFESPIVKNKSSFIISLRKNLIPIFKVLGTGISYSFYDINAKTNYVFSNKNKLFLSFYTGEDIVSIKEKTSNNKNNVSNRWGNLLASLRWNHLYSLNLFSNTTLSKTSYHYNTFLKYDIEKDNNQRIIDNKNRTIVHDYRLQNNFELYLKEKTKFLFGINSVYYNFIPNDENFTLINNGETIIDYTKNSKTKAFENSIYAEFDKRAKFLNMNIGARATSYYTNKKTYNFFEPRVIINFIVQEDFAIKSSYTKMQQSVHLLSYSGVGSPADYWMPSTDNIPPQSSQQISLSLVKTFPNQSLDLTVEAYYKKLENIITFKPGETLFGNLRSWENVIEQGGEGNNYGIEFFMQKHIGKTTGWMGLTLSKAERKFKNINQNEFYPYTYDRLVDFAIAVNYNWKKNINASFTWTYGSGYPVTLATERYKINGQDVLVYTSKNSFRMRDFHRLDIAIHFSKEIEWGKRVWSVSVFNLYNRKNPYYYYYERPSEMITLFSDGGVSTHANFKNMKLYQRTLFGFFPSISYSFHLKQKH